MILIVGLGNPGEKYQKSRHNLGFRVIDEFQNLNKKTGVCFLSNFKHKKKFQAEISEGKLHNKKIILAKPQTFMNLSGKAVRSLITILHNYTIVELSRQLWVVHDDIDIPLGKIKISIGRGSAGHKGVESIIKELKTKNFTRFRVGIKPKQYPRLVWGTEKFVLQKFNKEEEKIVKEIIKKTAKAVEFSLKEGLEKAMSKFNK